MKVEVATVECERNIDGEHHQMGIKSPRVIVDFMVNKLYTHKIKAITQEISCNARDAHREAGCAEQPIEITVPNAMVPFFSVKDNGIGMNYERLTSIYQFIGESSKRDANVQTGGFGIGAKCPWAYSDVFTTETVAWENGKKFKRVLVLHRTPENDISFDIISCEETNEPTGTIVKVPVKEQDFSDFLTQTIRATEFWNPKPIIKGARENEDFEWKKLETYLVGNNWTIYEDYDQNENFIINYDGVPYPIDTARFNDVSREFSILRRILDFSTKSLVINANIGDVNVALNREALEYSEKTINHIKHYISLCLESLKEFAVKDILGKQSLLEAMKCFHEHHSTLGNLIPDVLEWVAPTGEKIIINPATYIHIKGAVYTYHMNWKGRLKRSYNRTIDFSQTLLICKDAATNKADYEPARSQILGMMDVLGNNNNDKCVQVITSYDINDINTVNILKQNNLATIESYPRRKNKPRTTGGGTPTTKNLALCWEVGRYDLTTFYTKENKWADFTGKPYVLKETTSQFKLTANHLNTLDRYYTCQLTKHMGFEQVIAIRAKDEQEAIKNGLIPLYKVLLEKSTLVYSKTLGEEDTTFLMSQKSLNFLPTLNPKLFVTELFKNDQHIMHKFVKMVQEAQEIQSKAKSETRDYSYYLLEADKKYIAKLKQHDVTVTFGLNTLYRKLIKQYPMLTVNPKIFPARNNSYANAIKAMMLQAIQYINLVDKMGKKT